MNKNIKIKINKNKLKNKLIIQNKKIKILNN